MDYWFAYSGSYVLIGRGRAVAQVISKPETIRVLLDQAAVAFKDYYSKARHAGIDEPSFIAAMMAPLARQEFGKKNITPTSFISAAEVLRLFKTGHLPDLARHIYNGRLASAHIHINTDADTMAEQVIDAFKAGILLTANQPMDAHVLEMLPGVVAYQSARSMAEQKAFVRYLRRGTPPHLKHADRLHIASSRKLLSSFGHEAWLDQERKDTSSTPDIHQALAYIDQAMQKAESITQRAATEHWQAFQMQMQELFGVAHIALDEPYLEYARVRSELKYFIKLAKLEAMLIGKQQALENKALTTDDESEEEDESFADDIGDALNEAEDFLKELPATLEREANRLQIDLKQGLDAFRQQAFGIKQYTWQTDGSACPICAPLDGAIHTWGEGEEPGEIHPNCQCSATPMVEGAGNSFQVKLTDEQIQELLLNLFSLLPVGRLAKILSVLKIERLGVQGGRVLKRVEDITGKPTIREKPSEPIQPPKEILNPGGKPIGQPGKRLEVRIEQGGDQAARNLYKRLSNGGKPDTPKGYPGEGTRLQNGDWVGYRPQSESGTPTVDVNIEGISFKKIHFF